MVGSSRLSILNPIVSTSFNEEDVAMVGVRSPMYSAAVAKALCSTKSCWCLKARARAYQTGGASLESFMDQFQQVRKVCAEVLRRALVILLVPDPLVL